MKTFKYRLQPSRSQRTKLLQTLERCRWVFNETLATRKDAWKQEARSISLYDTNKLLTIWKQERPELREVFSQVLQNAQERVDLAFKAFFRRVQAGEQAGYPRFRGYGRYDSFTFKQFGFELRNNGLYLSKIGLLKVILHRPIEGRIKTLTIHRDAVGNWYACFACEVEPEPKPFNDLAIGIDLGLTCFTRFSSGEGIENPRFFRRDEKELAKAQRSLSKAGKGTPERAKRRRAVQHIHHRIANRRRDFAHQESRKLVNAFGLMVFEDLRIKAMLQDHHLAKSIQDAAWRQLIQSATYKAENAGRVVVLVEPRNTSQRCSGCGERVEKSLAVRVHVCPFCGLVMDRDQNAAINILRLGLESLGIDPESPRLRCPAGTGQHG
jgi:putative transposase